MNFFRKEEQKLEIPFSRKFLHLKILKISQVSPPFSPLGHISKLTIGSKTLPNLTYFFIISPTKSKQEDELTDSKDVRLFDYVASRGDDEWHKVKELTNIFRNYINEEEGEDPWLNSKWFGYIVALEGLFLMAQFPLNLYLLCSI